MPEPNFLILGAPRSATTFLYRAVNEHPKIFMSTVKEPGFFSHDQRAPEWVSPMGVSNHIRSWDEYVHLFDGSESYSLRGEASTTYLADGHAAERIKARLTEPPRMIAILRNPVDRAYSHYMYHRMLHTEPAECFEDALADEANRSRKNWNILWRYREAGLYGSQIARYYDLFGKDQLLILLTEDFQDQAWVMKRVFDFLGLDNAVPIKLEGKVNQSGVSKGSMASWILKSRNPLKLIARRILPAPMRSHLRDQLTDKPPAMLAKTRRELESFYRDDILRTQKLIGRDLNGWLQASFDNAFSRGS